MRKAFALAFLVILLIPASALAETSREDALVAIGQAELIMAEMADAGFPSCCINDTIILARDTLQRVDYAMLLMSNATGPAAVEAAQELAGLEYDEFSYDDVLEHTSAVSTRKEKAYELSDAIRAFELRMERFVEEGHKLPRTQTLLLNSRAAFQNERYTEAGIFLEEAAKELATEGRESVLVSIFIESGTGFLEKYWLHTIVVILVAAGAFYLVWTRMSIFRIKASIRKMETEKEEITRLIKQTQRDRFEKGTIPDSIYRVRMDKYNDRMNQIKRELPVQRELLRKKKKWQKRKK